MQSAEAEGGGEEEVREESSRHNEDGSEAEDCAATVSAAPEV